MKKEKRILPTIFASHMKYGTKFILLVKRNHAMKIYDRDKSFLFFFFVFRRWSDKFLAPQGLIN